MAGERQELARRALLGLAATGAGVAALGSGDHAQAHGTLLRRNEISGRYTYYEATGRRATFSYQPQFYAELERWSRFWVANVPRGWRAPRRIWTFGVHNDNRPSKPHNAARGFDLTRIYAGTGGSTVRGFYGRFDLWRHYPPATRAAIRRRYWTTSASLHCYFRHVLTYPYDEAHHSHIHVDNLVSRGRLPVFAPASTAQVMHLQACLHHVWGYDTVIDGQWGPRTEAGSVRALRRADGSGDLLTAGSNWQRFNRATLRYGTGRQSY